MTLRDEAWNVALDEIYRKGKFKLTDLPFKQSELHTVRRTCRELESHGWLYRESEHSAIWRAGPKAESLMNISPEKMKWARN